MRTLQVNEIFASVQGEGRWTGLPVVFLRLQGCNLDPPCSWCDTPSALQPILHDTDCDMHIANVLDKINKHAPRTVVVTGGEPAMQMDALVKLIQLDGYGHKWHIETNGTLPIPADEFDWITISPKRRPTQGLDVFTLSLVDELKYVITNEMDLHHGLRPYNYSGYPHLEHVWLQPVDNDPGIIQMCIEWLLERGNGDRVLGLSVQTHKFLGVR